MIGTVTKWGKGEMGSRKNKEWKKMQHVRTQAVGKTGRWGPDRDGRYVTKGRMKKWEVGYDVKIEM